MSDGRDPSAVLSIGSGQDGRRFFPKAGQEPQFGLTNALGDAARSSGLSFAGSLISAVAGFGLSLVVARMLGPSGSGVVFQLISLFTIAGAVAKLGLDTAAVWLLPRLSDDARGEVRRAAAILLIGGLLGGILAGTVLLAISPLLEDAPHELARLVRIAAAFMPCSSLLAVALAITRGLGGVRDFVLIGSIGLPAGRLAAVSVAMAFMATAFTASITWLAALVVATLLALLAAERALRPFRARPRAGVTPTPLLRRIAAFSGPRTVSSSIEQALLWLDVLIVGVLAGAAAAGVYGIVARLVQAGTIPSTSMRIVVAPQFSRMLHEERRVELSEFYTRTTQWIIVFSMPAYVLLAIMAEPILTIFGNGFAAGSTALVIMCAGAAVSASAGNVQSLLLMSGRSGWAATNKVIVLSVSVTLLLLLIPRIGIAGAAIATSAAIGLDAVLAAAQVRFAVRVHLGYGSVLLAVVTSGMAALIPAVVARLLLGDGITALIVGCGGAVVLWVAVMYLMRRHFALQEMSTILRRRRPPAFSR